MLLLCCDYYFKILISLKRRWNSDTCYSMMNFETIRLSELRQSQKDKYHMIPLI